MKKILTIGILTTLTLIALIGSGVVNALLLFVLVGALPGTSLTLSPSMTLTVLTVTVGVIITYITLPSIFNTIDANDPSSKKSQQRRRFSEI